MLRLLLLAALLSVLAACTPESDTNTAAPGGTEAASRNQLDAVVTVAILPVETTLAEQETRTVVTRANADVEHVRAVEAADGTWTFHVTVAHPDTGWEDYADGWDVVMADGEVLKPNQESPFTRLLLHPHVDEQPFTRSQTGIRIPAGVTQVTVRAHDLVDGFGGAVVRVDLTKTGGPGYEVVRQP